MAKPQAKEVEPQAEIKAAPKPKPKQRAAAKRKTPVNILDMSEGIFSPDFWRKLAPDFNIGGDNNRGAFSLSDEEKEHNKNRILKEGYTHLHDPGLDMPLPEMEKLFTKMIKKGLPPVFAFMYDELWALSWRLHELVGGVLHEEYAMLPDFWVWVIEPGAAGFGPHRDKGPDCLFADQSPKSITAWLPVTQSHPLNGCMYILPSDRDAMYGVGAGFSGALADIRALPGDPGDVFMWTQHAFHWGCHAADAHDLPPRMSVAFEYQRMDVPPFNHPLITPGFMPDFGTRLALIAKQIMQYKHLYNPSPELINMAQTILSRATVSRGGPAAE